MWNTGLIAGKQVDIVTAYTTASVEAIVRGDMLGAFVAWDEFLNGDIYPYAPYFHNVSGSNDYDNFMRTNAPASFGYFTRFVKLDSSTTQILGFTKSSSTR